MAFRISARTILELGAELISSDAVAIYELVKNAIDAKSKDGVKIDFVITLQHSDFLELLERSEGADDEDLELLKKEAVRRTLPTALEEQLKVFKTELRPASSIHEFQLALKKAYFETNFIRIKDTGCGMSNDDLVDAFLVIGTPNRKRAIDAAVKNHSDGSSAPPPFLGEKGLGRLSAMRLGTQLSVETATVNDTRINLLDIDWTQFHDLESMLQDIPIEPRRGPRKDNKEYSGTVLTIRELLENWSQRRVSEVASGNLARLSDPFSKTKRRFRIAMFHNEQRIDIPRLDQDILKLAHASAVGEYRIVKSKPQFEFSVACRDLGFGNPPETKRVFFETPDVKSITNLPDEIIPSSALRSVGPFSFEVYWYNRQLLRKELNQTDRKRVLDLQNQWSGIMLFRDGYRVYPYGEDSDDWLNLDRKALASPGYKLNKHQFIGRVSISRLGNPHLSDQTNREGLKDCPEKMVLLEVLKFTIQDRLGGFLDDMKERYDKVNVDLPQTARLVDDLESKAQETISQLRTRHPEEAPFLKELIAAFNEMKEYFASAKDRAETIEDEHQRMIHLAGVGLMLEVVAHELARATEYTLKVLNEAQSSDLPNDVAAVFATLRDQMKTMNKRLRVLDPLSVSARQRKETFDLVELVRDIIEGRKAQFDRHGIVVKMLLRRGTGPRILLQGVKGMFVQIVENLISNSAYWLNLRRQEEEDFEPQIKIVLGSPPVVMTFSDNGPGIHPDLKEDVFKPFFSTKDSSRRQGLGLYIARDCAEYHGGNLDLSSEATEHKGRLNTFVLEMPEGMSR